MRKTVPCRGRPRLSAGLKRVRLSLTLPPELAGWLGQEAARRGASLSQEAARLLQAARRAEAQARPAWQARLGVDAGQIAALCRALQVKRLSLFGSALTDRFRPDSDVDLLAEFQPRAGKDLFALGRAQQSFSELFGRKVDLVEPAFLDNPIRRRAILREAKEIYAAG